MRRGTIRGAPAGEGQRTISVGAADVSGSILRRVWLAAQNKRFALVTALQLLAINTDA